MQRQGLTEEEARNQTATLFEFDPDQPLIEQYVNYMVRLLQGDLGQSISSARTPVGQQLLKFLPWTLFSVGMGLLVSFTVGVTIGLAMAYWRRGGSITSSRSSPRLSTESPTM